MKYLIFGGGYIGSLFKKSLGDHSVMSTLRVQSLETLEQELAQHKPDMVINCIGKTGRPNIDWCETHTLETLTSNVTVPLLLLYACQKLNISFTHVGSGCIYQGDNHGRGFQEDDAPNFYGSFYSRTKIWSEAILKEFPVLQLRIRMPIDSVPNERNLITKITRYRKIISVPNSVTVMDDFLNAAKQLMERQKTGIYNLTNPGAITHAEMLDIYRDMVDPSFHYEIFSVEEMNKITTAPRSNCILSTDKLQKEGIFMRPIRDALSETLKKYQSPIPISMI